MCSAAFKAGRVVKSVRKAGAKRGGIRDALKIFWKPVEFIVDKAQDRTEFLSIHLECFPPPLFLILIYFQKSRLR